MSKHWRPEDNIVDGPWGRAESYVPSRPRRTSWAWSVMLGAVLVGAAGGFAWQRWPAPEAFADHSAIEWDAVQAVPTRTPDAADVAWQRRAESGSVGRSEAIDDPRLPRASGARNDAVRASFGYCYSGGGANCVVDGDTFYVGGEKVRIAGIDAPETHPPRCADEARLGNAATERLHALLNSGAVTMTSIDRDRDVYGRLLRNVAVSGEDVGEAMVSAGVAREYGRGRRPWCG